MFSALISFSFSIRSASPLGLTVLPIRRSSLRTTRHGSKSVATRPVSVRVGAFRWTGQAQPQLATGPGQQRFQRIDAEPQTSGNLGLRQIAVVAQNHRLALPFRQLGERGLQRPLPLGYTEGLLGAMATVGQRIEIELALWSLSPEPVATGIEHDLMQPGAEARLPRTPCFRLLPGLQEGLLTNVLGLAAIIQQATGRRMQPPQMAVHQLLEGALVAAGQRRQQITVGVDAFLDSWQLVVQVRNSVAPTARIFRGRWSAKRIAANRLARMAAGTGGCDSN